MFTDENGVTVRRTPLLAVVTSLLLGVLAAPAARSAPAARFAPAAFAHPGVTVSQGQLDFARGKVLAGAQPWKGAFDQMLASRYADPARPPTSTSPPTATCRRPCPART
ncbi:hypothetical protein GCM10010503_53040 [Streptomyces lucensis JCM 4490]|uniref:Uncharacterized protein n=1 Tax=Streptomyces lucensis JCM 4490 TaxID=1306176 RepID=A0A918JAT5_9ACTN|nr:hypothetical protein GCM10010503_53040 [Streptomyces lucensis JCM 4490]